MSEPLVLYPNRGQLVRRVAGGLTAAGVWGTLTTFGFLLGFPLWMCLLGTLFFALPAAQAILASRELLLRRPQLVIDDRGLEDNNGVFCLGRLPREEIEAVVVYRQLKQAILGVRVRNREKVLAGLPAWKARMLRGLKYPEGVSFAIGGPWPSITAENLARELHRRFDVPLGIGPDLDL